GGNGRAREAVRRPGRARRSTGRRFKPAATAEPGWPGVPAGRGVSRGEGSNRQQRRRKGRGRAPHPGAAPHGAKVQTGGDGKGRDGVERRTRPERPAPPLPPPLPRRERSRPHARPSLNRRQRVFRYASTASTRRLSSLDGGRSSLVKMLLMCLLTALSVMNRREAMAVLERPSAISPSTSRSRGVSDAIG